MPTLKITTQALVDGANQASGAETLVEGSLLHISEAIPAETTDLSVVAAIDEGELQGLYMMATVDMTVETNSDSAPDDTFALKANVPVVWTVNSATANPLTADVTSLIVTSPLAGTLTVLALTDPTPA